jgi:hypothetical protein
LQLRFTNSTTSPCIQIGYFSSILSDCRRERGASPRKESVLFAGIDCPEPPAFGSPVRAADYCHRYEARSDSVVMPIPFFL